MAEARNAAASAGTGAQAEVPPVQEPVEAEEPARNPEPQEEAVTGDEPTSALPPSTAESENAYRVKVGPYPGQVPVSEAGVILGMNSVGINIDRTEAGTVYYIGNYATEAEAQALLQVVKGKGINDSEVVKFENGTVIE